jgi:hypothetical protein
LELENFPGDNCKKLTKYIMKEKNQKFNPEVKSGRTLLSGEGKRVI